MNNQDDRIGELVNRARRDPEAFGELYTVFQGRIYGYVARRVPNRADADDLTAQVFLKVLKGISSFDPGRGSFETWLYRVAHNTLVDYYRAEGDRRTIDIDEATEIYRYDSGVNRDYTELYVAVLGLVRKLRPAYREVLGLRLIEGMGNKEIAELTGDGERYTAMKISRALKALRAKAEEAGILEKLQQGGTSGQA